MRRSWKLSTGGRLRRLERRTAGEGEEAAASMAGEEALDLGREEGDGQVDLLECEMERWEREARKKRKERRKKRGGKEMGVEMSRAVLFVVS